MTLTTTVYAVYALAASGLALAIYPALTALGRNINVEVATEQLCKLIRAGNLDRALKLCQAAPNADYLMVARAVLEVARDGDLSSASQADRMHGEYRAALARVYARRRVALTLLAAAAIVLLAAALVTVAAGLGNDGKALVPMGAGLVATTFAVRFHLTVGRRIVPAIEHLIAALQDESPSTS